MLVKKCVRSSVYIFILIFLLSYPQTVVESVKNALLICYENVIPSLFIFMVFSNYIANDPSAEILSLIFRPYARIMKVSDNKYPTYLFLSTIGGFAVGANLLNNMKKAGYSDNFLNVAAVSMTGNSMAFCLYAVGIGMLNNIYSGAMIYFSVLSAQLITAFLLSFIIKYDTQQICTKERLHQSFYTSLSASINAIFSVCGYVIVFYCICKGISIYTKNEYLATVFTALFEVTNGCIKVVSVTEGNLYYLCAVIAVLPVSTILQVYSFTENKGIIKILLFSRIIVLPLSLSILSILINIFPQYLYTSVNTSPQIRTSQLGADISLVLFMISFSFISMCEKNKLFTKS